MKNLCLLPEIPKLLDDHNKCSNISAQKFMIVQGKVYENGKYAGDVLSNLGNTITFKRISENKYLDGVIQETIFV